MQDYPSFCRIHINEIGDGYMGWEYKIVPLVGQDVEEELNNYGSAGWELVQMVDGLGETEDDDYIRVIFKRPTED